LHNGSYDDEPESFSKMKEYMRENALGRTTLAHREIYINVMNKDSGKIRGRSLMR